MKLKRLLCASQKPTSTCSDLLKEFSLTFQFVLDGHSSYLWKDTSLFPFSNSWRRKRSSSCHSPQFSVTKRGVRMKPKGQRSERTRARLEFRHSKQSRGTLGTLGYARSSLSPEPPYVDPFSSFSLFQRRCRTRSKNLESGLHGKLI